MALKREYASLDEIPEALRSAYVEKDGKFILDVEGDDSGKLKGALEKERTTRATLERTLNDIKSKLGDADPAKAREAMKTLAELEEKAALGEIPESLQPKIDALVQKRTDRMAQDYQTKLTAAEETIRAQNSQLDELLIDGAIRQAASKAGIRATAVDDAVLYGRAVFKRGKDGKPVPYKGEEVIYGKDGKTPMSAEEWVSERASDRPHWFEASSGTGATPPGGGGARRDGNSVVITRDQAKNPTAYRAAKEQAAKAGAELVIQ